MHGSAPNIANIISPAEKDLFRYLEPRLQHVREVSSFVYRLESLGQMFFSRRGRRAVDACGRRAELSFEQSSFSSLARWFTMGILLAYVQRCLWAENAVKKIT